MGRKSSQDHPALEYLMLSPEDKIQFRADNGISLKDWFESLKKGLPKKKTFSKNDFMLYFNISKKLSDKLINEGFFKDAKKDGESNNSRWIIPLKSFEQRYHEHCRAIERPQLVDAMKKAGFNVTKSTFIRNYSNLFYNLLKTELTVCSIIDAARIIKDYRTNQYREENWPSIDDLVRDTYLSEQKVRLEMIPTGELRTHTSMKLGGKKFIHPQDYKYRVFKYIQKKKILEEWDSAEQFAEKAGISKDHVYRLINKGKITAVELDIPWSNGRTYRIYPNESRKVQEVLTISEFKKIIENVGLPTYAAYKGIETLKENGLVTKKAGTKLAVSKADIDTALQLIYDSSKRKELHQRNIFNESIQGKSARDPNQELLMAYRFGGMECAASLLLQNNERFLKKIARQTLLKQKKTNWNFEEIMDRMGLPFSKSMQKFDFGRGYKFLTYAVRVLEQGLKREGYQDRTIAIPEYMQTDFPKFYETYKSLDNPSPKKVAEILGWTVDKVKRFIYNTRKVAELDSIVGDENTRLMEFQADKSIISAEESTRYNQFIEKYIDSFPEKEAEILKCRYILEMTLKETANHLFDNNLTKSRLSGTRIKQLEDMAKNELLIKLKEDNYEI